MTNIGAYNFASCPDLAVVNYPGTEEDWFAVTIDVGNDYLLMVKPRTVSGVCGDNLTYSFDTYTGILTISGTGDMKDYTAVGGSDENPFKDLEGLEIIYIGNGVTSVGTYAFDGCSTVTDIAFPASMDELRNGFLRNCNAIERLYCYGSHYCDNYFINHGYSSEICYYGDVDFDGTLTINDVGAIISYSTGNTVLNNNVIRIVADFNRDGAVDGFDAARVDRVI